MVGAKSHRVSGQIRELLDRGATGHLTDAQLLERFVRKVDAEAAFETLVLRHGSSVLRTCRQVLGHRGEADDAFQATFLVLARRAGSLHPIDSIGPWLQGVARRVSFKARTAANRRRLHERKSAVPVLFEPESRFEVAESVGEGIARLPEQLRVPVLLYYFERMSYKSAADELGVTEGTVRGRLAKARGLLTRRLSSGLDARSTCPRRDASNSLEHKLPVVLVDATTRAAVAFSSGLTHERIIATSVVRLAEGAINMMFLSRIGRFVAVILIAAAGTALVEQQTRWGRIIARTASHDAQSAAVATTERPEATGIAIADPKREARREILIQAAAIQTKPENDLVMVDGPGTMSLWVDRGFLTSKFDDSTKNPQNDPALLTISWTEKMRLDGRTTGSPGRTSCRIEFQGNVTALLDGNSLRCEQSMIVYTTGPVPFERIQIKSRGTPSENLARQPQTKIARISAFRRVVAVCRISDPEQNVFGHEQRIEADEGLDFDRRSGSFRVFGKGRACFYASTQGADRQSKVPQNRPSRIDSSFSTGFSACLAPQAETNAMTRRAEFSGDVTIHVTEVADPKTDVSSERRATDGPKTKSDKQNFVVKCDKLSYVSSTDSPGAGHPMRYPAQLEASGRVMVTSEDMIINGEGAVFHIQRGLGPTGSIGRISQIHLLNGRAATKAPDR